MLRMVCCFLCGWLYVAAVPATARVQMTITYSEITREQLLKGTREGFEDNQDGGTLARLQERLDAFYGFFGRDTVAGDEIILEYTPEKGTEALFNGKFMGVIPSLDFRNALLEIWLGRDPVDSDLKEDMLGLD